MFGENPVATSAHSPNPDHEARQKHLAASQEQLPRVLVEGAQGGYPCGRGAGGFWVLGSGFGVSGVLLRDWKALLWFQ